MLDLREISALTDFFLICSATSEPHIKAIVSELTVRLRKEHGRKPQAVDGFPGSQWIVADFDDVIVHVFHEARRPYYGLEELWSDAPRLKVA